MSAVSQPARARVLVIDDDKNIRSMMSLCLSDAGCAVTAVASTVAAVDALRRQHYDLAFLELRLGEESGLDAIPLQLAQRAQLAVVERAVILWPGRILSPFFKGGRFAGSILTLTRPGMRLLRDTERTPDGSTCVSSVVPEYYARCGSVDLDRARTRGGVGGSQSGARSYVSPR
jgi:CheY-like chemotaxis protein